VVDAALVGGAAVFVLLALSLATTVGWPWLALGPLAVPLVAVWRRRASSAPARGVLGAHGMPGVHIALLCSYTALFVTLYLAPFYLQDVLHAGPTGTGLTLLAYPAASAAVGLMAGALTDRLGGQAVAVAGAVLVTGGLALVAADPGLRPFELAWRLAVVGVGFGLS
jgi:hypothetical protein